MSDEGWKEVYRTQTARIAELESAISAERGEAAKLFEREYYAEFGDDEGRGMDIWGITTLAKLRSLAGKPVERTDE